jgi:integrase
MPRARLAEQVAGHHFAWLLKRRDGVWYADGRSGNPIDLGRHSLGTRDEAEARRRLIELDAAMAIRAGIVTTPTREPAPQAALPLSEGRQLYLDHAARPRVLRGVRPSSQKRYRTVLDKFLAFARHRGLSSWNEVSAMVLKAYITDLDRKKYAYRTLYLEANSIKQVVRWLAANGHLPSDTRIDLPLQKPQGTATYCWRREEVNEMLTFCRERADLNWLGDVLRALATTGLRIGELAALRQSDVDMAAELIHIRDESMSRGPDRARTTKSGLSRSVPIHASLLAVINRLPRLADGRLFHGPRAGRLKPDTVRRTLVEEVLKPLAGKFPKAEGEVGFVDGRLHSFRHFFVSECVQEGIPERTTMRWVGHRDSEMVNHYYHLHDDESRRQMARLGGFGVGELFNEENAGGVAGVTIGEDVRSAEAARKDDRPEGQ